ncbi:MAG TPA: hypothetical protein VK780_11210 [Thermoanaerobaculia bacterium]|nr:hypothetical protein [Thermoanaerobaculia bacterium]
MADESPRFHVVDSGENRRGPRRPGPAVAWILVYAGLFAAGLLYFRAKSPLFRRSASSTPPAGSTSAVSPPRGVRPREAGTGRLGEISPRRESLLAGEGLPASSRGRYFERLATDRCNCGCDRSLADCLVHEPACTRSPELAGRIWMESRQAPAGR